MWNPTTSTNTESENKKKENVEGEGNFDTAVFGAAFAKPIDPNYSRSCSVQQSLNDFGNNSKKEQYIEESQDSGFVSGVLSSNIDSEDLQDQSAITPTSEKIPNLPSLSSLNIQSSRNINKEKEQQEFETSDSGYIDDNPQKQVSHESSNIAVGGTTSVTHNKMKLEQNVDLNISEQMSNLNLQSDLNNLNSTTRTSNQHQNQNQNQNQQNQSQRTGNNKQQPQPEIPINPSNAWEYFYQQNEQGDTPLHIASASGETHIVAALIRMAPHPCLFNIQNYEGQTALHIAARAKQPRILRMLLMSGAEPIIRDCRGNTALHLACYGGEMQSVCALTVRIEHHEIMAAHQQYGHRSTDNTMSFLKIAELPPDLEIRNYDGERCVHIAAQQGHMEILRHLELFGADINAREGCSGYTPLHIAILCNNDEIINYLLNESKNLNLEAPTYAGLTAYQIADTLEKYQMTDILKARGAEPLSPPESECDCSDLESDDEKEQNWFGGNIFSNYTLMVA